MKIDESLEESASLIRNVSEIVWNEAKEQKDRFLSMFLGTLGASLSWNLLTGKGVKAKIPGRGATRAGKGTIRAGQELQCRLIIL